MQNSICSKITIDGQWYLFCGTALLLVPLQWVFGWIIAAIIHELGHFAVLKLFHIQICAVKVGIFGARIITEPFGYVREFLCALAGPLAGLCTLFFIRQVPYIALSGLVQSCYNLIPVFPLDGGRALRAILLLLLPAQTTQLFLKWVTVAAAAFFLLIGIWTSQAYDLGIVPIFFPAVPIFLAAWKNSLQSMQKNSTIQ